jgi:hypothetical protein
MTTTFENKASILADLWLSYRDDDNFQDFFEYNDLGLPLAYAIANGIIETTDKATGFIDEAFDLLLTAMGQEDTGYDNLDNLLST